jgi:hypothetical protein
MAENLGVGSWWFHGEVVLFLGVSQGFDAIPEEADASLVAGTRPPDAF